MRAASNPLMRSMLRSSPIGSVQKAGYESQTPSEHYGRRLWASTTKLFCATIGDIQRIVSRLSKALACPIAVSGNSRFNSCCGASGTAAVGQAGQRQNTGTDLFRLVEI